MIYYQLQPKSTHQLSSKHRSFNYLLMNHTRPLHTFRHFILNWYDLTLDRICFEWLLEHSLFHLLIPIRHWVFYYYLIHRLLIFYFGILLKYGFSELGIILRELQTSHIPQEIVKQNLSHHFLIFQQLLKFYLEMKQLNDLILL